MFQSTAFFLFLPVEQLTNVVLYSSDTYTKPVCCEEFGWGEDTRVQLFFITPFFWVLHTDWFPFESNNLQGDGKLQLHPWEVLQNHSSAGQQQGEARALGGWAAKRRGHPPSIHHPVSHPVHHVSGEGGELRVVPGHVFDPLTGWWRKHNSAALCHPLTVS